MNVARSERPARAALAAGGLQGGFRNVGPESLRRRQLGQQRQQDRAGAGAEIGDAQRTIEASAGAQQFQRQFDHRLGIRPRHQRRGRELQRQPPKFLLAENAGDRFAREATAGEFLEACRFVRGELALRGRYQAGQVEAKGMARQNPRVEFGGFDGGGFESAR